MTMLMAAMTTVLVVYGLFLLWQGVKDTVRAWAAAPVLRWVQNRLSIPKARPNSTLDAFYKTCWLGVDVGLTILAPVYCAGVFGVITGGLVGGVVGLAVSYKLRAWRKSQPTGEYCGILPEAV